MVFDDVRQGEILRILARRLVHFGPFMDRGDISLQECEIGRGLEFLYEAKDPSRSLGKMRVIIKDNGRCRVDFLGKFFPNSQKQRSLEEKIGKARRGFNKVLSRQKNRS